MQGRRSIDFHGPAAICKIVLYQEDATWNFISATGGRWQNFPTYRRCCAQRRRAQTHAPAFRDNECEESAPVRPAHPTGSASAA